jgi:hypothetical protein
MLGPYGLCQLWIPQIIAYQRSQRLFVSVHPAQTQSESCIESIQYNPVSSARENQHELERFSFVRSVISTMANEAEGVLGGDLIHRLVDRLKQRIEITPSQLS